MTKEELLKAVSDIDELLEENRKLYEPFVGKRLDSFTAEEVHTILELQTTAQKLVNAKSDLRQKAINEFGIFVM